MALLNRPSIHDNLYDPKGRLQGGLSALEDLAQVIQLNGISAGEDQSSSGAGPTAEEEMDDHSSNDGLGASVGSSSGMSDIEPAMELPVSGGPGSRAARQLQQHSGGGDTPSIGSSDMSPGSSVAEEVEDDDGDDDIDDDIEMNVQRMEEVSILDEPFSSNSSNSSTKQALKIDTSSKTNIGVRNIAYPTPFSSSTPSARQEEWVRSYREGGSYADAQLVLAEHNGDHTLTPQVSRAHRADKSRHNSSKMIEDTAPGTTDSSQTSGSKLKRLFLDLEILPTLVVTLSHQIYYSFGLTAITCFPPFLFAQDLFFEFKWNNFLHSVVYDIIHQILTGNVRGGLNRDLVVSLFRDARLMQRIVEGQKLDDLERYLVLSSP